MNIEQIQAARERLRSQANVTPVMTSRTLNRLAQADVFLKCENFQRGGAFKFRGAFNAMCRLSDEQRRRGVITYSSGNHGQAVALVGQLLGIRTTVVVPQNASLTKRLAAEGYGATVVACEARQREEVARKLLAEQGCTLVPPFDHDDVIAGQGTAALELFEQTGPLDWLLSPVGGGGLISGTAVAAKHASCGCRVVGVEPDSGDDAVRSFRTKTLQRAEHCFSIADGTRTPSLGTLTFPLVLQFVDDMLAVSEEQIQEAVRFLFFRMKLVVEPSGALGVAAILSGAAKVQGRVGVILSGGNIDAQTMKRILDS